MEKPRPSLSRHPPPPPFPRSGASSNRQLQLSSYITTTTDNTYYTNEFFFRTRPPVRPSVRPFDSFFETSTTTTKKTFFVFFFRSPPTFASPASHQLYPIDPGFPFRLLVLLPWRHSFPSRLPPLTVLRPPRRQKDDPFSPTFSPIAIYLMGLRPCRGVFGPEVPLSFASAGEGE